VKRTFGTFLSRLLNGGTSLTPVEYELLTHLVAALPPALRATAESQFEAYNLVQREVDGRALNFYRRKAGRVDLHGLPLFEMTRDEAPLVRLTAKIEGEAEPVHATLNAVAGRAFCIAFSRALPAQGRVSEVGTKDAWRSNFTAGE
jgi:hypothetical protein